MTRIGVGRRPLLVVPGWRLDAQTELPVWQTVLEQRPVWSAFLVDLPGHGESSADQEDVASVDDMLERLLALVDERFANTGAAVAGNSNGAAMAIGVARARPGLVRGLSVRMPMLEPDNAQRDPAWKASFDALPDAFTAAHARREEALWDPARARADGPFLDAIRDDPARYGLTRARDPLMFDAPALVVLGRQDAQVGWSAGLDLLRDLPRATVTVLDRCGHLLPVGETQTQVWQALALDWLDRVEETWDTPPERRA